MLYLKSFFLIIIIISSFFYYIFIIVRVIYFRIFIYIYLHVSLYIVCVAYPLNVRSTMEIRGSHLCDFFLVFPFL